MLVGEEHHQMKCRYLFYKEYNCCLILVVSALCVYEDKLNNLGGKMSFFWVWLYRFSRTGLLGLRLPMGIFVENFTNTAVDVVSYSMMKQMIKYVIRNSNSLSSSLLFLILSKVSFPFHTYMEWNVCGFS